MRTPSPHMGPPKSSPPDFATGVLSILNGFGVVATAPLSSIQRHGSPLASAAPSGQSPKPRKGARRWGARKGPPFPARGIDGEGVRRAIIGNAVVGPRDDPVQRLSDLMVGVN